MILNLLPILQEKYFSSYDDKIKKRLIIGNEKIILNHDAYTPHRPIPGFQF